MENLTDCEKLVVKVAIKHFKESLQDGTLDLKTNGLITNDAWVTWAEEASKKLNLPKI